MAWKLFVFPIFLIGFSGIEASIFVFPHDEPAGNHHKDLVSVNVVTSSLASRFGSESDVRVLIPKRCQELGFCEDPVSYPDALAAKLSHEIEAASMFPEINVTPRFSFRMGRKPFYENPCKATNKNVAPRLAYDGDGVWYFVLNTKERPIQTFNVELCEQKRNNTSSDRQECSLIILESDYESACVQKYVYRGMLAMVDKKTVTKAFKIPCCCTCVAKYLYE